ncbi:hypothetical protein Rt10032_c12g4692 [Rhodotorula toruloides]|uniref:Uncharacterized protein n=1 Tax=Rhodotorula toruloides TaxID=5286 RepID=A0A511KL62_RHOTO|nr:hypothetical protein Rt10032_c12g4692 [Rhodotorula toruloides]
MERASNAYGGSVVQNGLAGTGSAWPATQDQVASFLSDLKNGKAVVVGSGRTLFYFNSGINPVTQLWQNALSAGMSSSAVSSRLEGSLRRHRQHASARLPGPINQL